MSLALDEHEGLSEQVARFGFADLNETGDRRRVHAAVFQVPPGIGRIERVQRQLRIGRFGGEPPRNRGGEDGVTVIGARQPEDLTRCRGIEVGTRTHQHIQIPQQLPQGTLQIQGA